MGLEPQKSWIFKWRDQTDPKHLGAETRSLCFDSYIFELAWKAQCCRVETLLMLINQNLWNLQDFKLGISYDFFFSEFLNFGGLGSQVTSLDAYCNSDEIMDLKNVPFNESPCYQLGSQESNGLRAWNAVDVFKNLKISRFPMILTYMNMIPIYVSKGVFNAMWYDIALFHREAALGPNSTSWPRITPCEIPCMQCPL